MYIGTAPNPPQTSKRAFAFLIVVAIHVLLIYALNSGLTDIIREKVLGNMQTVDIVAPKVEDDKPPPPPPKVETTPPPFVPLPEISIETAPAETTTAITQVTTVRPVEPPPVAAPRQKVTVQPKVDAKHGGLTKPEYPPSEKRAEHAGTVYLQLLILESGRVGEARIQTSSGFPKLDESAVSEAKRSWRFVPGTEDGKPVQMWVVVPLVFKLEN